MTAPIETPRPRHIPRTRRSPEEVSISRRHPILSFLVRDERWRPLGSTLQGRILQRHVLRTAKEAYSLTYEELLIKAKALDEEIPQSPYLRQLAANGSTLMDLHDALTEVFGQQTPEDEQQFDRVPPRILQINYAGRLLGRRLELSPVIGWSPRNGFEGSPNEAQTAINLCFDAMQEVIPPHI